MGRRGKSNQSFMTLIFPSQQLPPMTVIYMPNRRYYVYKIILGKEDLNNFCQPSKGAGMGSDAGFLFPLLSYMCFAKMPGYATRHSAFASMPKPVGHTLALIQDPQFSNSRAAGASTAGESAYQVGNNGVKAGSPRSSTPRHTTYPTAEDNLRRAPASLISHAGTGPNPTPPEHLLILCPS